VQELGARPAGRRGRRRPRAVEPTDPETVPVTRLTVSGEAFEDSRAAERWLADAADSPESRTSQVRAAVRLVNRALGALRASAGDPLVQDLGATRALAVRIGYGDGDALAEGRWSEARELQPPRRARLDDVDPQTRVAAVLAGRDAVHPAETLLLRARLDADQGRRAEALYGLRAARQALEDLPGPEERDLRERIEELGRKLES
jgi:hypothetical protein